MQKVEADNNAGAGRYCSFYCLEAQTVYSSGIPGVPGLSFIDLTIFFILVDGIASTTTQAKPLGLEVEDPPDTTIRLCDV